MTLHDVIYLYLGICIGGGIVSVIWFISDCIWYKKFTKHLSNKEA